MSGSRDGRLTDKSAFRWPGRSREAVALFANGKKWSEVAEALGVAKRRLERWHAYPEFQVAIAEQKAAILAALKAEGIANEQNRIDAHNELDRRMWQIVNERAADPSLEAVPGGRTGFMLRTLKVTPGADPVEEFSFDAQLEKSIRANMQQMAQERGQWNEKAGDTARQPNSVRRVVIEEIQYGDGSNTTTTEAVDTGRGYASLPLPSRANGRLAP